jgi:hypothetical protein
MPTVNGVKLHDVEGGRGAKVMPREEWALDVGRRIDRGESSITYREARTFGDLVRLHRADLEEVGKRIERPCGAEMCR